MLCSLNHGSAIYSQLQPFSACWLRCVTSAPGTAFSQVAKHHIGVGYRHADVFALLAWALFLVLSPVGRLIGQTRLAKLRSLLPC